MSRRVSARTKAARTSDFSPAAVVALCLGITTTITMAVTRATTAQTKLVLQSLDSRPRRRPEGAVLVELPGSDVSIAVGIGRFCIHGNDLPGAGGSLLQGSIGVAVSGCHLSGYM